MIERIKEHLEFHQAIDTHKSDTAFLTELLAWIEAKDQLIAELQQERDELAEKLSQGHEFVKETGRMLESERHKPFWSWHKKRSYDNRSSYIRWVKPRGAKSEQL